MDDLGGTQLLESTSIARHVRNTILDAAQPQSNQSTQFILDYPSPTRSLSKRKSLRARPTELLGHQHAAPPLPLRNGATQPELRPRPSKMSLFSLFSKPKVEKLHGYAESGLDTTPRAMSHSGAPPSRRRSTRKEEFEQSGSRPPTFKSNSVRVSRTMNKEPPLPLPALHQQRVYQRAFEPLPLFQVWPQAIRQGIFEVSTISHEMVLQRNRQKLSGNASNGGDSPQETVATARGIGESRTTVMTAFRSGSITSKGEDTSRKLFVLVTSGYLLQYAETGASDRMPEKHLKLGRNSAAFASDLIPGKHHVLQVSQAVDADGGQVNDRQSIFSKFSLRSHAPRRVTSSFLIVMPGATELDQWLTALRREIQQQGGRTAKSKDPAESHSRTGEAQMDDLQQTPSHSHRYRVKRDPSKVLSVISPTSPFSSLFQTPSHSPAEDPPKQIAIVEQEPLNADCDSVQSRPRATSETLSLSSSTSQSMEQQQPDKLRDSTRISHASTAATTVSNASRTNSMTSSPPAEQVRDTSEGDLKPSYRSLSSYSLTKRQSAVPMALNEVPTLSSPEALLQHHRRALADTIVEFPSGESKPFHSQRLFSAKSVPNLHAEVARHDSKVTTPSFRARPESFLGDLPDTTAWTTKASPSHHRSFLAHQSPTHERPSSARAWSNSKNSSPSFSLPLRVNAINAAKRMSTPVGEDNDVLSPIPAVHVLNAKVDVAASSIVHTVRVPPSRPSVDPRQTSARLSLFPSAETPSQQHLYSSSTNGTLRRPTSLQVRHADQAAFLSSSRPYPSSRNAAQPRPTPAIPIRSLKPSRSLQTIPSDMVRRRSDRQDSIPSGVDEKGHAIPLATGRRTSPPASRSFSRTRTAVLPGDFRIPLGPPAPPPSAPLPELPAPGARSRSKSPMPESIGLAIGESRSPSALTVREV